MQITVFGCKIYISLLFFTMLSLILFIDKTGLILFGIAAVIIHELGHLAVMIFNNAAPREIILQPIGIIIKRTGVLSDEIQLKIAAAGCSANLIAIIASLAFYVVFKSDELIFFIGANMGVMCFNLLIIKGLDGYDILYLLLRRFYPEEKTEKQMKLISCVMIFLLFAAVFYLLITKKGGNMLSLCAIYLTILAIMSLKRR